MNEAFMKKMYEAVQEDVRIWNEKMENPSEKRMYEEKRDAINKSAYETAKQLTRPGYIDRNKRYKG